MTEEVEALTGEGSVEDAGRPAEGHGCGFKQSAGSCSAGQVGFFSPLPPSQGVSTAKVSSCFSSG